MTAELATFVAGQMAGDRVRAMFGGWAIYRDGEMVAIVYEGRAYLKATTKAAQIRFIAAGMGPFRPRAKQTFTTFWEVAPEVVHDADELAAWKVTAGVAPRRAASGPTPTFQSNGPPVLPDSAICSPSSAAGRAQQNARRVK